MTGLKHPVDERNNGGEELRLFPMVSNQFQSIPINFANNHQR
jgi:hypothetical protein